MENRVDKKKGIQRGFTLIELMVIVAIVGILASVSMAYYNRYMQNSSNAACLAEAKSYMSGAVANFAMGVAISAYTPTACESSSLVPGLLTPGGLELFTPKLKGDSSLVKTVACSSDSASCNFQ